MHKRLFNHVKIIRRYEMRLKVSDKLKASANSCVCVSACSLDRAGRGHDDLSSSCRSGSCCSLGRCAVFLGVLPNVRAEGQRRRPRIPFFVRSF